jgi:hypothetical protein
MERASATLPSRFGGHSEKQTTWNHLGAAQICGGLN